MKGDVMDHDSSRRTVMIWRIGLALGLLLFVLDSPAFARGSNSAKSPVGAWDTEVLQGGEFAFRTLDVFNFGGTWTNSPAPNPENTGYGSWRKVGKRQYKATFYILYLDDEGNHIGYLRGEQEFSMVGKDRQEGVNKLFFLLGLDPLSPDEVTLVVEETFIRRRLKP
jgi:hypothetical protein